MRIYVYTAIDSLGERVTGEIEAPDPDTVVSQLTARGLRVENVQLADRRAASEKPPRSAGLSAVDAREIGRHVSEIMSAGLPLEGGLAAVAEEFPYGRVRRALRSIVRHLEAGNDLESVLAAHRTPAYLPALVKAGQRSGRTGEILENFIIGSQMESDLRQTLWTALAYPLILIFTLFPLLLLLQMKVVPQFGEIFDGFGIQLPVLTQALLVSSEFLRTYGIWFFLIVCGAIITLVLTFRAVLGRLTTRHVLCRVPLIGPLLRWSALARFSPLLSVLLEARVPLDEALLLAGDASGDAEIENDCRQIAAGLRSGESLSAAAAAAGRFPASFVKALTWDRQQGHFPELLRSMTDLYAGRAFVMLLAVILPPLTVVFVASVVGGVVILLFMPLIELLNKLS